MEPAAEKSPSSAEYVPFWYCTPLTSGLIGVKLKEHRLANETEIRTILPGESVSVGAFRVEAFSVAHSIPDAAGFAIRTPMGTVQPFTYLLLRRLASAETEPEFDPDTFHDPYAE